MNIEQELLKQAAFGIETEAFVLSAMGKYLINRAETEAEVATDALKIVDPTDCKEITRLQAIIWRAESFQRWLAELIQAGNDAEWRLSNL